MALAFHVQVDERMPQYAAAAIAGHGRAVHKNLLERFHAPSLGASVDPF